MEMANCRICLKYTPVNNSHVCDKCADKEKRSVVTDVRLTMIDGKVRIENKNTRKIMSKSEWFDLKRYIDAYYFSITQDEIDEINRSREKIRKNNCKETCKDGYIYLMLSSNGYYKIGRSYNVERRKIGHIRDFPIEIDVLHSFYVDDCIKAETALLRMFKSKKLQGEWFALNKEDVKFVTSITDDIAVDLF